MDTLIFIDKSIIKNLTNATKSIQESKELEAKDISQLNIYTASLQSILASKLLEENKPLHEDDRLLDIDEAAEILGVNKYWIYHRSKSLPFIRHLGRKLRCSEKGLQKYITEQQIRH